MEEYKWRTRNTSYVYVDARTGDDDNGDGTQQKPYKSLGRAWRGDGSPSYIVCRGTFSEDMADGTQATTIAGDYWGAAVFDGGGEYTMFGFTTPNMIFRNCPVGMKSTAVYTGNSLIPGVGRAYHAHAVGNASNACGVSA